MWGRVFDLSQKIRVELDRFALFAMPNDYIGASIISARTYEPHVTDLIKRELHAGDTFLDLGANLGYFSMLAASIVGPSGRVIAFEPNPQNLQLIYESQLTNGFDNLTVYPYAASDRSALLRFTTVGSNGGVLGERNEIQKSYMIVPAVVIDEVLAPSSPVSMVKMDIEAHEPFAVRGMSKLLSRDRPKLITEYHPWAMRINNATPPEAYLEQLEALGYRLGIITPSGVDWLDRRDISAKLEASGNPTLHLDLYGVAKR